MDLTAQQCRFCLRVRYHYAPDNFQSEWMKDLPPDVKDAIKTYPSTVCENAACVKKSAAALDHANGDLSDDDIEQFGKIVIIPRAHIRPFPNQPRKYFDQLKLRELANSIREVTQLVPILVKEIERESGSPHRFELIDGQRRWHACDMVDVKKMKAIIMSVRDEEDQFTISVISNFGRVDHSPVEAALAIKRFRDNGKTVPQIANTFARSEPWVYSHLRLLLLDQEVLNLMSPELPEEKRLLFSTALYLSSFPPDEQKKLAKRVVGGKLKHIQAKAVIRQEAEKMGIVVGDPERTPNKDYNVLWSFLFKLERELEISLQMPQSYFDRMFASRSSADRVRVLDVVENSIAGLKMLMQAIQKTKKE